MKRTKSLFLDLAFAAGSTPKKVTSYPRFANYEVVLSSEAESEVSVHGPSGNSPEVSVIVSAFGSDTVMLERTILSLLSSDYIQFTAVFVLPADRGFKTVNAPLPRCFTVFGRNETEALRKAEKVCRGEYLLFLKAGDILRKYALNMLVSEAEEVNGLRMVYADSDELRGGIRTNPHFKAEADDFTELCSESVGRPLLVESRLHRKAGGFTGSGAFDLYAARCLNNAENIIHLPKSLLTKSRSELRNVMPVPVTPRLTLVPGKAEGFGRLTWTKGKRPLTSVIIRDDSNASMLRGLTDRIALLSDYPYTETVISYKNSYKGKAENKLSSMISAAEDSRGKYLVFISSSLIPNRADFIEELVTPLLFPGVGVSGGKILTREGLLEHTGFVLVSSGNCRSFYENECDDSSDVVKLRFTAVQRTVSAVCLDFFAVGRKVLLKAANTIQNVNTDPMPALCKAFSNMGLKTVYTPFASAARLCMPECKETASRPSGGEICCNTRDRFISPHYDMRFTVPRIKL